MHDVFISYSSKDTTSAVRVCAELESKNIPCWIAKRDVRPGEQFDDEINKAIKNCIYFLFLWSSNSIKSDEVRNEVLVAKNCKKRIIPLRLEDVSLSESLEYQIPRIQYMDLFPKMQFDVTINELADLIISEISKEKGPIATLEDVKKWGWNENKLLEKLIGLDYEHLEKLDEKNEGSVQQWAPVFRDLPDTWRLLIDGPQNIVGYWHFVPLQKEYFEEAKKGRLLDSQISGGKLRDFIQPGLYDIYFITILIRPEYKQASKAAFMPFIESIVKQFVSLAEKGIFINEICAWAFNDAGKRFCKHFEMTHLCNHVEKGEIYLTKMFPLPKIKSFQHNPELVNLYSSKMD